MNILSAAPPVWAQYLLQGVMIFILLSCGAVIAARAGRNPYWSMLFLVPFIYVPSVVVMLWLFAFVTWPKALPEPAAEK
jgi:hypothetical protein